MNERKSTDRRKHKHLFNEINYDSEEKEVYRERIWLNFEEQVLTNEFLQDKRQVVLLLPSYNGQEIEVALAHKFPPEKIIAVDENEYLRYSAPWIKKYPNIRFYGSMIKYVGNKIKKDNLIVRAANLDLCNNFSDELISQVSHFYFSTGIFTDILTLAITTAVGREKKDSTNLMNCFHAYCKNKKIYEKRHTALLGLLGQDNPMLLDQGKYTRNIRYKMAWSIFNSKRTDLYKVR